MLLRRAPRRVAQSGPIARLVDRCALEPLHNFSFYLVTSAHRKGSHGWFPSAGAVRVVREDSRERLVACFSRTSAALCRSSAAFIVRVAWCGPLAR